MNISFREPQFFLEIKQLIEFLWNQDLGYPSYHDWVTRTKSELDLGYKKAIIAYDEDKIIGDVIFQPHKELPKTREIKNLRVSQDFRFRKFGSFLLRQAEWVNNQEYHSLIADFRDGQQEIENLMISEGFEIVAAQNLYDEKIDKIAFKKNRFLMQ